MKKIASVILVFLLIFLAPVRVFPVAPGTELSAPASKSYQGWINENLAGVDYRVVYEEISRHQNIYHIDLHIAVETDMLFHLQFDIKANGQVVTQPEWE